MNAATFAELGLDEPLLAALEALGFNRPTTIQAAAIPPLLEGRDVLAGATTGSGKTAAFALPLLQQLLDDPPPAGVLRKLILAPTRELALQLRQTIDALAQFTPFRAELIIGGMALQRWRSRPLPPIVVSTPGRMLTLLEEELLSLDALDMVAIDEADRMLDMGLGPDVNAIVETLPQRFQAALFSATLAGEGIEAFARDILDDPVRIGLDDPDQASPQIQQVVYHANDTGHKLRQLETLIDDPACTRALVFCNRKATAEMATNALRAAGIAAATLHGDLPAPKRLARIEAYRQGRIKALVSTDLAGRGLDVPDITHVINFDLPPRADLYIHRIGRTGRGRRVGIACNLVVFRQLRDLQRIEYRLKRRLPVDELPGLPLKGPDFAARLQDAARRRKQLKKAQKALAERERRRRRNKAKQRHRRRRDKGRPRWSKERDEHET